MTASDIEVPSIAGIAAMDTLAAIREIVGEPAYLTACDRLSAEQRSELETITAVGWFPNTTFNVIVDEIAHAAGIAPEPLLDKAIRLAVQRTFKTVWRVLLRVTSDEALIKRTPMIYARGRNTGQLSSKLVGPGHAEAELSGWPDVSDRTLRSIGVGIQSVVELAGRRDVRFSYARTAGGGRYDVRWKV